MSSPPNPDLAAKMDASDNVTPEALQPIDMARERATCSFDIDAMTCVFAGNRRSRDRARWLMGLLEGHAEQAFDKNKRPFLGRTERFMQGQRIALEYFQLRNRYGLPKEDRDLLRLYLDEYITLQVHESMGHPTTQNQSSEDQWKRWGPHISSGRWLLCYAQTEMAHGSNLAGLRTTARFIAESDEWVSACSPELSVIYSHSSSFQEINTPEPSAGKLWIGGSGSTATHALVMAKLLIGSKDYGMHPFLVPLRDPDTHRLLEGRSAIDMGPKKGAPSMDNGFLQFDRVRIPRDNLLARFQTVDEQGNYKVQNQQGKLLIRGAMTLVRVGLCEIAAHHAARATLIAIRYAVVRRQGSPLSHSLAAKASSSARPLERQIIDYPGVQQRLFTAIASSYALTFAARHMRSIYNQLQYELRKDGQSELLSIVHGYTSVLKAVMTNESYNVVWRCRKSMGGLGFSAASGLTDLENSQPDANLTYEGDNNMLLGGPAANFLVKELRATAQRGQPSRGELAYLASRPQEGERYRLASADSLRDPQQQLSLAGRRAARAVYALFDHREKKVDGGGAQAAYFDARLAARASRAHGAYFILYAFNQAIAALQRQARSGDRGVSSIGCPLSQKMLAALERVRSLYALQICILDEVADYTEDGYLSTATIDAMHAECARLMIELRPDALGLAEAADMSDWYLASPLGSHDGRAYDRMIEFMRSEPINQSGAEGGREADGVLKGFRQTLGRLTHGEVEPWNEQEAQRREKEREAERMSKL
jgi:alkylation response protein AidB-like acyl-CoA dehydrogenase